MKGDKAVIKHLNKVLFNELTATISRREWRLDWADDRERAE